MALSMDDAMASSMSDAMDTPRHGVVHGQPIVVHGRCHESSHGRRVVYELFHGTVHGPVVCAMEHAMVLGSIMAPSMVQHGRGMDDFMVAPIVHVHGICHGRPWHVLQNGGHAWMVHGIVHE